MKWLFFLFFTPLLAEPAYAQIYSAKIQQPVPVVGTLLKAELTTLLEQFELSESRDRLICKIPGLYFASSSIQPAALNYQINGYLDCWFELNGKAISASSTRQYVMSDLPIALMTIPFILYLNQGDSLAVRMTASGPDIGIIYIEATPKEPIIPSFTLSIFKVSP